MRKALLDIVITTLGGRHEGSRFFFVSNAFSHESSWNVWQSFAAVASLLPVAPEWVGFFLKASPTFTSFEVQIEHQQT